MKAEDVEIGKTYLCRYGGGEVTNRRCIAKADTAAIMEKVPGWNIFVEMPYSDILCEAAYQPPPAPPEPIQIKETTFRERMRWLFLGGVM